MKYDIENEDCNFRLFFESMDDLLFMASGDGQIIHSNKATKDKLGYSDDILKEMNILELYPKQYRIEVENIYKKLFLGKVGICNIPLIKKDGTLLPAETKVWLAKSKDKNCIFGISKDISKQQKSIEKFYKFFNNNPELMAVIDMETRELVEVNQAFLKKLCYKRCEVIGKTIIELSLFVEDSKTDEILQCLIKKGRVFDINLQVRSRNSNILDGLLSGEVIRNEGKSSFLIVIADITQQRYKENELIEAKTKMKAILDNFPYIAWLKNENGLYIEINKAFQKAINKSSEDILGSNDYNIWPTSFADKNIRDDLEIMRSGKQKYEEVAIEFKGEMRWVELYKMPIFDSKGLVSGLTGVARDITKKKKLELEMESQKRFLKQILNAIPDLIFYKDASSTYIGCNHAFAVDFLGLKEAEIIGKKDLDIYKDKDAASFFVKMDREVLESGKPRIYEETLTMADNRDVEVETIKIPFYKDGKVFGVIGISRDISLRKSMEYNLLMAKEQAEAANVMKTQFISNMSHEIRTPINAILGYTSLLRNSISNEHDRKYIDTIERSGNTLLMIINDILDLSKIEAGKIEIQHEFVNIYKIIEDIKDIFFVHHRKKNISMNYIIDESVPTVVLIDEMRIRQILFNLIGNSIKFTESGFIELHLKGENFQKDYNKIDLVFQVEDSGIGIPEDQQKVIFQPFKQKEGQSNRKYGGTGLGLSIVKRFIELMGGTISLKSTVGEGTTFKFTIPEVLVGSTAIIEDIQLDNNYIGVDKITDEQSIEINSEFLETLEELESSLWKECKLKNRIRDVRELGNILKELSKKYTNKTLEVYSNELLNATNSYNSKNIRELIGEFPDIIKGFKK